MKKPAIILAVLLGAWGPPPSATNQSIAQNAYDDTIARFWWGERATGHIVSISDSGAAVPGLTPPLPSVKGHFWEYGQVQNVIYSKWKLDGSSDALTRLQAQWNWVKYFWSLADVSSCGVGTTSTAEDDAAWGSMALVQLYEATGDPAAAQYAQGMIDCAWSRWQDSTTGGGLWYSDDHTSKSSYQAPYALAALHLYQLTGNSTDLTYATSIDTWASTVLARAGLDSLYWAGVDPAGTPLGVSRPYDIFFTNSVVLLAGDMAFAALDAELYMLCTGNALLCPAAASTYLARAQATAASIRNYETVPGTNAFLNARDPNVDGWAADYYARFVVPLLSGPGYADAATLKATALSIALNTRNADATYGGDWQGPPQGIWFGRGATNFLPKVSVQAAVIAIASNAVNP